jgi:hypothetical protein
MNVGGFFAELKLVTNSESFKKGEKNLKEVGDKIKHFSHFAISAFSLAGAGVIGFAGAISAVATKTNILASSLQMSSTSLSQWQMAASMAGTDANGLTSALLNLQKKADRLKMGEVDMGMAKSLGMLGLGYQSFLNKSSEGKMQSALNAAMKMKDKGLAGELIRDVLGDAGKDMFEYLKLSGQSMTDILAKAKALTFTTDETRKGSMIFGQELKSVMGGLKEIGSLFAQTFGTAFTPVIKSLGQLIIKNKELIKVNVIKFAKDLAKFGKSVFDVLAKGIPIVVSVIDKLGGIEGVLKKVAFGFSIFYGAKMISGIFSLIKGIGVLNALKLGGIFLAFTALYYIINDIATYMAHKGGKSWTGAFVNFINKMSNSKGALGVFANALLQIGEVMKMIVFSMQAITTGDWSNIDALTTGWKNAAFEQKTISLSSEEDQGNTIDKLKKIQDEKKKIKVNPKVDEMSTRMQRLVNEEKEKLSKQNTKNSDKANIINNLKVEVDKNGNVTATNNGQKFQQGGNYVIPAKVQ